MLGSDVLCQAVYRCGQILLPLCGELVQAAWKFIRSGLMSSGSLEHKFTDFTFHFRSGEYHKASVACLVARQLLVCLCSFFQSSLFDFDALLL